MADEIEQVTEDVATDTGSAPAPTAQTGRTFSQAEVDDLIKARLDRERKRAEQKLNESLGQYADYETLKEQAAKWQEIEEANKSEAQKAADRAARLEKRLAEIQSENARLAEDYQKAQMKTAVVSAATRLGFADPSDAWAFLDPSALQIDEGEIKGVEEALKALAEAKPYLLQTGTTRGPTLPPTNPGRGTEPRETDEERRQRLFGTNASPFGKAGGGVFSPPKLE